MTDTRARILQVAARLFDQRGYHGLAMREIAEEVGVSKPAVYFHFKDKEALFLGLLDQALDALRSLVHDLRRLPDSASRVERFVQVTLDQAEFQGAAMRLAAELRHVSPQAQQAFSQVYARDFVDELSALVGEGVACGELRPLGAEALTWGLLGLVYPYVTQPELIRPDTRRRLQEMFLRGAAP